METPQNQKSEKGFLSKVWKAHTTVAKYVGLFGIPAMLGFLPKAAFNAHAANPAAGIPDIIGELWGMMGGTIGEFMIPGWSIIFGAVGQAVGSIHVPEIPGP